jgi:toxin ParE1/3/4
MGIVHRTPAAVEDLIGIWSFIDKHSTEAADRMLDCIEAAYERLGDFPEGGRRRDDLLSGLRSLPVGRYIIFYRRTEDGIEVVRVLHGARDLPRLFEPPSSASNDDP